MAKHILFCPICKRYSMQANCPICKNPTASVKPPKYSPDDKYAEMKREIKKEIYEKEGLL